MLIEAFALLAAVATPPPARPVCQEAGPRPADRAAASRARPHTLAEEPPANHVLGVLRREDGCSRPVVVRREIGRRRSAAPRRD